MAFTSDNLVPQDGGYGPAGLFNDPQADVNYAFAPNLYVDRRLAGHPERIVEGLPWEQGGGNESGPGPVYASPKAAVGVQDSTGLSAVERGKDYLTWVRDSNQAYYDSMNKYVPPSPAGERFRYTETPWPSSIVVHPPDPDKDGAYYSGNKSIGLYPRIADPSYGGPENRTEYSGGYLPANVGYQPKYDLTLAHELGHFFDMGTPLYKGEPDPRITALSWAFPSDTVSVMQPTRSPLMTERYEALEPWADQFARALELEAQGVRLPRPSDPTAPKMEDLTRVMEGRGPVVQAVRQSYGRDPRDQSKALMSIPGLMPATTEPLDLAQLRNVQKALFANVLFGPLGYAEVFKSYAPKENKKR